MIEKVLVEDDLELLGVDRNRVLANDDTWVVFDFSHLLKPDMLADIARSIPLGRVRVEDLRD